MKNRKFLRMSSFILATILMGNILVACGDMNESPVDETAIESSTSVNTTATTKETESTFVVPVITVPSFETETTEVETTTAETTTVEETTESTAEVTTETTMETTTQATTATTVAETTTAQTTVATTKPVETTQTIVVTAKPVETTTATTASTTKPVETTSSSNENFITIPDNYNGSGINPITNSVEWEKAVKSIQLPNISMTPPTNMEEATNIFRDTEDSLGKYSPYLTDLLTVYAVLRTEVRDLLTFYSSYSSDEQKIIKTELNQIEAIFENIFETAQTLDWEIGMALISETNLKYISKETSPSDSFINKMIMQAIVCQVVVRDNYYETILLTNSFNYNITTQLNQLNSCINSINEKLNENQKTYTLKK